MSWRKTYIYSALSCSFVAIVCLIVDHFIQDHIVHELNLLGGFCSSISVAYYWIWRKKWEERDEIFTRRQREFSVRCDKLLGKKG